MSKKIRLVSVLLFASLSMAALMWMATPQSLTLAQGGAVAPTNTKSATVAAATTDVLQETSTLRKLSILRPVKSGAQSRAEIERMIIKNLDEDTTPEEMHASEVALKKLGLVPQDFQYRPFIISLLTEQVAGYYDPKAREFYLADWIDVDGQKPVMAHELTHALQDQHFNLRRFEKWPRGDSDAELAAHALIEGDATLAMKLYITRNPLRAIAMLRSIEASGSTSEQIDKAPRALRESLLFPYERGLTWVESLYKREAGWNRVSQAYTDLPQSTEQIMHVEKYYAREAPVKLAMPDFASALGAGWKRIDYDVNGEWSFYLILDEYLKSPSESQRAAEGWGGDRYAVYEDKNNGGVMIAQLTSWDTERDAVEFYDAYARRTARRYAGAPESATPGAQSQTLSTWQTSEGTVLMERRGSRVLILEGLPDKARAKPLLQTIWQNA
ncbi:MAG TPA: hypothetical protein VF553_07825 [Pyrinomonadaceae bacterium]|jgi:hypothetical protein